VLVGLLIFFGGAREHLHLLSEQPGILLVYIFDAQASEHVVSRARSKRVAAHSMACHTRV
jgi:hypothetical protein